MAGMDLTSLLLLGAGAYALTKMGGDNAFGQQPGQTTQSTASNTVLDTLQNLGVNVKPTDQVQQITTTTPAGQTITYATVNYSPWDPQANQTVWLSPFDTARLAGLYIPQFPANIIALFGSEQKAVDWYTKFVARIDAGGQPQAVYDLRMPVKDWDALRTRADTRQQPITPAEAAAAGFTLEDPVNLNGYWDKVQQTGGFIRGVELLKGDRASFNGLGMRPMRLAPKYYYFQ